MYYIYILKCADDSYYVGFTTNLISRMKQHNDKTGGTYTGIRTPVQLVYKEEHKLEYKARNREKQLKGWTRQKKEALIKGDKKLLIELSKNKRK
jgi:putative endonuclease